MLVCLAAKGLILQGEQQATLFLFKMATRGIEVQNPDTGNTTASTTPGTHGDKMDADCHYTQSSANLDHSVNEAHATKTTTGLYSEHGHNLTHVRPMAKHSGSSVSTFFNGLFTTIIGIATLGASITFSYVLSNNTQPPSSRTPTFNQEQIQQFLAVSWLLFLLALAFASLGSTLLTFFKNHWIADWDGVNGATSQWSVQIYAVFAAGVMGGLTIAAFSLLCLVVVAYSAAVGWIALGFTAFLGVVIIVTVVHQYPFSWRDNTPSPARRHRTA